MLPSPPVPTAAAFDLGPRLLEVFFDGPLTVDTLDPSNWRARYGGYIYPGATAYVDPGPPQSVVVLCSVGLFDVGPDRCWYDATPPDLLSAGGVPVAAFADFPIV